MSAAKFYLGLLFTVVVVMATGVVMTQISDSEWKVMEVVWKDEPVTASQVGDALGAREKWTPQTIKTLIARLVKKGVLTFAEDGRRYLYSAAIEREQAVAVATNTFLDRVSRGSLVPMLAQLVDARRPLRQEEVEALRELLANTDAEEKS